MRFDLKVPFSEKDAAKKLGARWDAARKVWYVVNADDLSSFAQWSPVEHDGTRAAPTPPARPQAAASAAGKVQVGARYVAHPVVCDCPPWEVCDRCRAFALPD